MREQQTLPQVVGCRVRELRQRAGRTQDELADAARMAGLDWTQGSVASLETGRRGLSAIELLLLPVAFAHLDDRRDHTLAELLDGAPDEVGVPSGSAVPTDVLRRLVLGEGSTPEAGDRDLSHMAARDTERHAARSLGVSPGRIVLTAVDLWGHGLAEERERRMPEAEGRSLRAVRGHVTRQLLDELRSAIEEEGMRPEKIKVEGPIERIGGTRVEGPIEDLRRIDWYVTVPELRRFAEERGVRIPSRARKDEIVQAIKDEGHEPPRQKPTKGP